MARLMLVPKQSCQQNRSKKFTNFTLPYSVIFQDDPLCVERPVDESGCCVLVLCAADTEEDENSPCQDVVRGPNAECKREVFRDSDNTICVCKEGFTGDPDSLQGCSQSSDLDEESAQ